MTSESPSRQKKSASGAKSPDGEPRKKSRNRTTQSCMNCHTSKRMCDRKRPACSRCVQLGLIGLCVYEVDDPSQGTKPGQDESARLIKRVAELESVIRELKNKPTPRWVQASGIDGVDTRQLGPGLNLSSSPAPPLPGSHYGFEGHQGTSSAQVSPSSESSSSSGYGTATSSFASTTQATGSTSDTTSAFSGMGVNTHFSPVNLEALQNTQPVHPAYCANTTHCGCLHEPTSYRTMLELSLGLRRASDVLGQSPGHRLGEFCPLHQRVLELDSYAM
ncbi:hypothetical protein CPB84DRAFT_1848607 [Gymnopilus junonius]|uniref:Zn(2)-C6 fungal-type domain-containing protein n=1 Tax=Gymnopilus junonius TaxID=109634 RepID=A0A9P5NJS5_GYMJU|nr:hypothetical protein CPB84DRAFT_1848607 [Gymnopilus junonius]